MQNDIDAQHDSRTHNQLPEVVKINPSAFNTNLQNQYPDFSLWSEKSKL